MAKLGFMSFAHLHAHAYAHGVNDLPDAELVGIWDDDPARGEEAARLYKADFYEDVEEFLACGVEGVIIASENSKHRQLTEWAAASGKWVLSEKPLAPDVEDAQAMVDTCKKAGVGLGTAFPVRYAPPIAHVRQQVLNGDFGEIYAATCTNNGQYPGGWFGVKEFAGGGATMDHTVHIADVLRWMLQREFTMVHCEGGRCFGRPTELDDLGCLQMEMEGGVMVSHIASWCLPKSFPLWGDVTLELIGEKGVVQIDALNQKLHVYNDTKGRLDWVNYDCVWERNLIDGFNQSVEKREEPPITGEDGLRAAEVTVAAYESMRTGKAVCL